MAYCYELVRFAPTSLLRWEEAKKQERGRRKTFTTPTYANNVELVLTHTLLEELGDLLSCPGASRLVFGGQLKRVRAAGGYAGPCPSCKGVAC